MGNPFVLGPTGAQPLVQHCTLCAHCQEVGKRHGKVFVTCTPLGREQEHWWPGRPCEVFLFDAAALGDEGADADSSQDGPKQGV